MPAGGSSSTSENAYRRTAAYDEVRGARANDSTENHETREITVAFWKDYDPNGNRPTSAKTGQTWGTVRSLLGLGPPALPHTTKTVLRGPPASNPNYQIPRICDNRPV